jgi:hypothetical protein
MPKVPFIESSMFATTGMIYPPSIPELFWATDINSWSRGSTKPSVHLHSLRRWIFRTIWHSAALQILAMLLALVPLQAVCEQAVPDDRINILWTDPGDIRSRNLYYGPGGTESEPKLPVKFLKEDLSGTSPKFDLVDARGHKWKAKVGDEAQPETAATRLLWAVGYFSNENYFFPDLYVRDMPPRLKRGQNYVSPSGHVKNVRLQQHPAEAKGKDKVGNWNWKRNPFVGTREYNGLRVMMALLSNWDLYDQNNAIWKEKHDSGRQIYEVTDLGASFGKNGRSYTDKGSKGNLKAYSHTKLISKITPDYVNFNFPARPPLISFFDLRFFCHQIHNRWIGKHIPRSGAKWIGSLLAQLSPDQIKDAFRAAGYSPEQVEGFATAVQSRIAELNNL